jgi:hypothetical protein
MGGIVFANSREISGKATGNESLAAMPDICLSPPSPPAGPIPIPYPNFSKASDTDKGSKTVKIRGKPAGLKNKSNYKKSKGDEAATRNFGMGVVTHKIQGASEHMAWSMDVKIEGANVLRLMDMTTHNHGSPPFNLALTMNKAAFQPATGDDSNCDTLQNRAENREKGEAPPETRTSKQGEPTTHTAGHFQSGDQAFKMISSSKASDSKVWNHYSKGLPNGGKDTKSKTCPPEFEYKAQGTKNSKSNHTEARMIEDIFSGLSPNSGPPGSRGTLTMAIDHEFKNDAGDIEVDNNPCPDCHNIICKAVECGLNVVLCKGKPPRKEDGCPEKSKQDK